MANAKELSENESNIQLQTKINKNRWQLSFINGLISINPFTNPLQKF